MRGMNGGRKPAGEHRGGAEDHLPTTTTTWSLQGTAIDRPPLLLPLFRHLPHTHTWFPQGATPVPPLWLCRRGGGGPAVPPPQLRPDNKVCNHFTCWRLLAEVSCLEHRF